MADWIDNYGDFFPSEQEIVRLFRMYDERMVSQQYLMTLFDLDEEGFEQVARDERVWRYQRQDG
jgi:hypothetical protein